METDGVPQLKLAKAKIDQAIENLMAKVAIYRKRSDALQHSINILCSSDEELDDIVDSRPAKSRVAQNCTDPVKVEKAILSAMQPGDSLQLRELSDRMEAAGVPTSYYTLRKVLATCPSVQVKGERTHTRYSLK